MSTVANFNYSLLENISNFLTQTLEICRLVQAITQDS